ncbi:hypothetical protein HAY25_001628 [Salmonella enterica]|nr:hypothetical protein [Salmonella enterica]
MNKFEGVTVLRIDDTDYTNGRLCHLVERETATADVVIDGGKVIKSRIFNEVINNEHSGKPENQINQLANAQKLNAIINAFRFSWVELSSDEIEAILNIASEYTCSIESYLTQIAEGKK